MANTKPIFVFPIADDSTLAWAAVIVFGFFALAIAMELYRRRRERLLRIEAEWRAVRDIAQEKELSAEESRLLEQLIRGHAPKTPFRAATVRQEFDKCIEAFLDAIEKKGGAPKLEELGVLLHDIRSHLGLDYIPLGQRIYSTRELYHHQMLWIAEGEGSASKWYRMRVCSVDEAHFYVMLDDGAELPAFNPGDELHFRMWREEDARYLFMARLVRAEESPPLLMFRHSSEMRRMQARAHYRIRHSRSADIGILNMPVDGDMSELDARKVVTRIRGRTTSLSGGGFAVEVPQPVPKQVLLRVPLELEPGREPVQVTGKIVAVQPLSGGRYLLRSSFVGMDEETREKIAYYVTRQQQLLKAKESNPLVQPG